MVSHPYGGEPWRVGILFSQTGATAIIEESQLKGTLLAIEEINSGGGINDRELVPIVYDPQSDDQRFAHLAEKLLVEDGVTTIFGCYRSSSRKAVLPIVERRNGLLWYPTLYEGFEYSPNIIYTGAAPNQNAVVLAHYLLREYGTRFYFVGSNYVYPHESNRIMRILIQQNGGEVVGERYVDISAGKPQIRPIIHDIKRLKPDVVFSTVVGDATVHLYQEFFDAGFDPKISPIASLTTSEAEVSRMGDGVAEGSVAAAPYFESVSTECNKAFVSRFKQRFGETEPTNMCLEASYFQVHMFAKALANANEMDTDLLRSLVLGSECEAPQGTIKINETCNHTDLFTRVGRVDRAGRFEIVQESKTAVTADPYLVYYGCGCPVAFH